jgi:hypothetical protein
MSHLLIDFWMRSDKNENYKFIQKEGNGTYQSETRKATFEAAILIAKPFSKSSGITGIE